MGSSSFIRWAGLAAMVGGVLWRCGPWDSTSLATANPEPRPLTLLLVVAGFFGLHTAQRRSYGWPGRADFVTTLAGRALALAGSGGEFWVFTTQPYGASNGRDASWTIYLLGHLVLAIGSVLLGIATVRARVLARKPSIMFAVLGVTVVLRLFGALIFAIPFTWLGYALWSGRPNRSDNPNA